MKRYLICFLVLILTINVQSKHKLYLIAGHGSDIRIFSKINFPENLDTVHLHYFRPVKNESMHEYALRLSQRIDTTESFSIMGVSLGGMLAAEMTSFLNPVNVIIVSSAAGRSELPLRFRMMRNFEIYRIFSGDFYHFMAKSAQLLFEPDRKNETDIFDAMLQDKDPEFLKRGIHMIANWIGEYESNGNIFHIHGTKDHTVPIRKTCSDLIVENGSHMMALTNPQPISDLLDLLFGI
jgi:pimeloyl-ACP methyl ester carboxylesterase